jgi:pSer/pThr/pTyr-binding forkhead associated (FHA) protein
MDAKLVMFRSTGQRKEFPLAAESTTSIGRGEECNLQIPLASVSRKHCELTASPTELKVKDLASSNGTYVNNRRVNEVALKPGDRLVVGPIVFTVQINGEPADIQQVKTKGQRMAEAGQVDVEEMGEVDVIEQQHDLGEEVELSPAGGQEEDIDPISALEAMASESKKKNKK